MESVAINYQITFENYRFILKIFLFELQITHVKKHRMQDKT